LPLLIQQLVFFLEALQLDLHRSYTAKIYLGEAIAQEEGTKAAAAFLQNVAQELDQLLRPDGKAAADPVNLPLELTRLRKTFDSIPNPVLRAYLQQRADLLARDWAEQGAFASLRARLTGRL